MGRSVAVPSYASAVAYTTFEPSDPDDNWDWECAVDDLKAEAKNRYPSLEPVEAWIGNEIRVVMRNRHARITVSEYCGCVAIAVVPNDSDNALSLRWASQVNVEALAEAFGGTLLRSIGHASNGEQFFSTSSI